ncbi:Zn-ribbon domain-containing OB-fold protein [Pseudooceanicola sp. LIPI14-2-Ac024]|uniref:Zn-ribbon domain-containing OB-fold protein n=1 Tax=Pseudooceanicola sp. LIPI14-2-Ac024 TaxID=3344875 RepID=UPI0035D0733B
MSGIAPDRSGPAAAYWDALDRGRLCFQRCWSCGAAQLPAREECTTCLSPDLAWEAAAGGARLISWVVYHRAYHDAFADMVPYNVAVVELDEGPRLISNILAPNDTLRIDMPLRLELGRRFDQAIPQFRPA